MTGALRLCAFALAVTTAAAAGSSGTGSLADLAQAQDRAAVHAALEAGADPNSRQVDGMTALHWAAHDDDLRMVEMLLDAGADPEPLNRYGVTPLSLACQNGSTEIIKKLLDAGADPNAELRGGETPLMTAARTGKLDAVRTLLVHGADVNAAERAERQTALMWAAADGHADVVELLLEFGAKSTTLDSGFTPFLFAVREGRLDVVRTLLEAGADPNQTVQPTATVRGAPRAGTSALHLAVQNAHFELAAALLEAGADPNPDLTGYTPLHLIPSVRKPGVGDNDPAPPGSGSIGSLELVRILVERGADIDARMTKNVNLGNTRLEKRGATPFFLAAQSADAELLRTLAELGADPFLTNEEDSTALMAAAGLGTRSPGEDAGTQEDVLEALEVLLDLGLDVNAVDVHGETVMHGAAYKNLPGVVEFLAENGADIGVWNKPNEFGWTPLVIAEGYRFGNFKPSVVTVAAIHRVMRAAGVEPPPPTKERPGRNRDY